MIIWGALGIPIVFAIGILLFFRRKIIWWEITIPLLSTVFIITIFKFTICELNTRDTEFWNNNVVSTCYYEDWNEYIHQTCTRTVSCGENCTTTETYDCSYVDYHSEYYTVILNSGREMHIRKEDYLRLKAKFDNNYFVDLNRNYHTNDGDLWKSDYDESFEDFELIVTKHTYRNKVQASDDIFNFPEVDTADISFYGLYNYPEITGFYKLPAIIGPKKYMTDQKANKKFDWINGKLGMSKQLRLWILIYENKSEKAGKLQEALWKGGNKNEFVVSIGVDQNGKVQWCYPFSWTEVEILKIETRNFVHDIDSLDLSKIADFLEVELNDKFVRKEFSDFNYLSVEPPLWAVLVTYGVTFILNLILSVWVVNNEYE